MEKRETSSETPVRDEGRRKLLKAAAVAGGAVAAAAALPGAWQKPLATIGGLPAHAQSSDPGVVISGFTIIGGDARAALSGNREISNHANAGLFGFEDFLCEVDDTWSLSVRVMPCGGLYFVETLAANGATIKSKDGGCSGSIIFNFDICNAASYPDQEISLQLRKGARYSNVLNASFSYS